MKSLAGMIGLVLALVGVSGLAQAEEAGAKKSIGSLFIISSSTSEDPAVSGLQYSDDDALSYQMVLGRLARNTRVFAQVDQDSVALWSDAAATVRYPDKKAIMDDFAVAAEEVRAKGGSLVLVLIGHGGVASTGEGYLVLPAGRLEHRDLIEMLAAAQDLPVHLVVDTCNAYDLVRPRGGEWKPDAEPQDFQKAINDQYKSAGLAALFPNVGFMLSSASNVKTYEMTALQSGVFSFILRSALLGGADANRDGKVTYPEVGAFTAAAVAGVDTLAARPAYVIQGPSVEPARTVVDLGPASDPDSLELTLDQPVHLWFEDRRGYRIAEVNTDRDTALMLTLPLALAPFRGLRETEAGDLLGVTVDHSGAKLSTLNFASPGLAQRDVKADLLRNGLFKVPYGVAFFNGYHAGTRDRVVEVARSSRSLVKDWQVALSYRSGPSAFSLGGLQHGAALGLSRRFDDWAWAGLMGAYSTAFHELRGESFWLHRYFVGVLVGARWPKLFGRRLAPFTEVDFGHQWLVRDSDSGTKGDPLSFLGSLRGGLQLEIDQNLFARLAGGYSMQVVTVESSESADAHPVLEAGIGWQF